MDALAEYVDAGLQNLKGKYSEVRVKLDVARDRLADVSSPEDCQAVGLICRDAMIRFANAIFSPDFVPEGSEVPAEDRAGARIDMSLQHFGQMAGSAEIRRFTKTVVAYAMRLHHSQDATQEQAQRTVLYTTLALIELAALMEAVTRSEKWVQQYGVYKCDNCASTKLTEDVVVDVDSHGVQSATKLLVCSQCGWVCL